MKAVPHTPGKLRARAEALTGGLPPLLADAERLAATVMPGEHGRRRPGPGEEFWQYRPATYGDPSRRIDWRRSARSDSHFVREREWQAAQSVVLWVDGSRSMAYSGGRHVPPKSERARLLALSLAVLLVRAGERVGLAASALAPRSGQIQLERLAAALGEDQSADYGAPHESDFPDRSQAVLLSDFLGPLEPLQAAVAAAAERGVRGALVQVLDPTEEDFPFDGRTIFESMGGSLSFETLKAGDLRGRYLARLAERREALQSLARATGWLFTAHHTGSPAAPALLWLYGAMERGR